MQLISDILHRIAIAIDRVTDTPQVVTARSPGWSVLRDKHLLKQPYCLACGNKKKKFLEVHHIKPVHFFPELELAEDNLVTLCNCGPGRIHCHLVIGHCGDFSSYNNCVINDCKVFRDILFGNKRNVR